MGQVVLLAVPGIYGGISGELYDKIYHGHTEAKRFYNQHQNARGILVVKNVGLRSKGSQGDDRTKNVDDTLLKISKDVAKCARENTECKRTILELIAQR